MSGRLRVTAGAFDVAVPGHESGVAANASVVYVVAGSGGQPIPGRGSMLSAAGISALIALASSYLTASVVNTMLGFQPASSLEVSCTPTRFRMPVLAADAPAQHAAVVAALQTAGNVT